MLLNQKSFIINNSIIEPETNYLETFFFCNIFGHNMENYNSATASERSRRQYEDSRQSSRRERGDDRESAQSNIYVDQEPNSPGNYSVVQVTPETVVTQNSGRDYTSRQETFSRSQRNVTSQRSSVPRVRENHSAPKEIEVTSAIMQNTVITSRKHTYIILTLLNPIFI